MLRSFRGRVSLIRRLTLLATLALAGAALAGAATGQRAATTVQLSFVNLTDKVGSGSVGKPDGRPDGHFRVTVSADGTVTAIILKTADAAGKACCGQVWDTLPSGPYWILGVFRGGKELNPTDTLISSPVTGSADFDVYATSTGYFKTGQRFLAEVSFADGSCVSRLAQIGGAASAAGTCVNASTGGTGGGGGGGGGGTTTTTPSSGPPTGTATGVVLVNGRPFTTGTIPYNSTIDVTRGTLKLKTPTGTVTVHGAGGISAVFVLKRGTDRKKPLSMMRLVKGDFGVCGKRTTSSASRALATVVRQLWADGKGQFRTQGRYSSATVRGTNWLTADRCDGTLTKVKRGIIQVSDFPKRTLVTVRAGKSYLAKP